MTDKQDRGYRIMYPETDSHHSLSGDGGHATPQGFGEVLLETRERIGVVEAELENNQESLDRIEAKVDTVQTEVEEVDEKALDIEYFRDNYRNDIERNSTITYILVWGGGVLLALTGIASTTAAAMGVL